ncbi:MAG: AMP-binding protein [Candidatus Cloacimonetes bacterium]|nr:AMP-binding protein [Candidatus Cloacimonadota bacterium]
MDKLFWIDDDIIKSYQQLIKDTNNINLFKNIIYENKSYVLYVKIVHSLINDYPITLLDCDFSNTELTNLGFLTLDLQKSKIIHPKILHSVDELFVTISNLNNWKITLLTSGTTGVPKKITHTFSSITKSVKISKSHNADIWGFAYNPTHMAGIQVFFQAFLNMNTIVNIFNKPLRNMHLLVENYLISHISATPTFYRLFVQKEVTFVSIKQVSCGGEKLEKNLKIRLKKCFPYAKIRNIYASTEAGSLFASKGEYFKIPQKLSQYIKIIDSEILIHKDILGVSNDIPLQNGWYYSGDIIEIIEDDPEIIFKFLHRKNEMINVGGYKVNPNEVEEEIRKIENVNSVRVYGLKNSVLGNILCADIVVNDITEKEIRKILSSKLQPFKSPRFFNFVKKIEITRTGKIKR